MKWIWIRHGETEINRAGRYLGHYDEPLSDYGMGQIHDLAERLTVEKVHYIYSSDLQRTKATAEILSQMLGTSISLTKELSEFNFGEWDLKTYEEIMSENRKQAERWYNDPFVIAPPNGETVKQLGERVDLFLQSVQQTMSKDDTALIISHGGPMRWFLSNWIMNDVTEFWTVQHYSHADGFIAECDGERWTSVPLQKITRNRR